MWKGRAAALLDAVTAARGFDRRRGLFGVRRVRPGRAYAHLWPFACAWSAMETASDLGGATGSSAAEVAGLLLSGLAAYAPANGTHRANGTHGTQDTHDTVGTHGAADGRVGGEPVGFQSSVAPPLGRGGDVYYDDNAWVALALLEHHRRRHDQGSLSLARRVVAFCCTGWHPDPGWSVPGGIRWKVRAASRSRNTCANGPVAEAAALVHARTGDPDALAWAVRIYGWVRAALLGPDGLYLDRIMPDGTRAPERWTYNQGTMIGAGVLLAEATGERRYLEDACATADASLASYDVATLLRNGPAFNAIFFRNLFLLDRQVPDSRIGALAAAYADAVWDGVLGRRAVRATGRLGTLNATAPLVEVYALLAGATPHP